MCFTICVSFIKILAMRCILARNKDKVSVLLNNLCYNAEKEKIRMNEFNEYVRDCLQVRHVV